MVSSKRIFALLHKDITLFFKGRRKIRKRAEILYFISLFIVSFFLSILYRRVRIETGIFALTFTFFLYLLMSFIFELKHFIFFEEDIKIVKRLPILEREYYLSKGLLVMLFGLIFSIVTLIGHVAGAYFWASRVLPVFSIFVVLLLNTFFSISFSMLIYALLLRVFRNKDTGDIVSRIQIVLGILFGLIFAFSPNLAPLLDAIDSGTMATNLWFKFIPFSLFISLTVNFSLVKLGISLLYIIVPLFCAVLLGFNEGISTQEERLKEVDKFIFVRDRRKRGIYHLVLTHLLRSKITKRTLIAPATINMVVLFFWSFSKEANKIIFFGVWTLIFMSVIVSLGIFISDSYKSSWLLRKIPMFNGAVIANGLNAGFFYVVFPYGIFVFTVFLFKGLPLIFTVLPVLYGLVMSYLFMHILFLIKPTMIFSRAGFERGINSVKELFVSFILVPSSAVFFNFLYSMGKFSLLKVVIVIFLLIGYFLNHFISKKSFNLTY